MKQIKMHFDIIKYHLKYNFLRIRDYLIIAYIISMLKGIFHEIYIYFYQEKL